MNYKIITPVEDEPVSLSEARTQVHLTADDGTGDDALLTAWIVSARETAEHYTGRALAPQTLEVAMDGFPVDVIDLPRAPVASIASVKYTDLAGVEQTVPPADYSLSLYGDANRLAPAFGKVWPTAQDVLDSVRIRYVAGYTNTPQAVRAAILMMVAWMFDHRGDEMTADDIQPPAAKSLLNTVKDWAR